MEQSGNEGILLTRATEISLYGNGFKCNLCRGSNDVFSLHLCVCLPSLRSVSLFVGLFLNHTLSECKLLDLRTSQSQEKKNPLFARGPINPQLALLGSYLWPWIKVMSRRRVRCNPLAAVTWPFHWFRRQMGQSGGFCKGKRNIL